MILLILTPILIGWFFATRWLARRSTSGITTVWKKQLAMWVLVPLLFLLPFADGIIGGIYLRHLCSDPEGGFVVVRPFDSVKRARAMTLPDIHHGQLFYAVTQSRTNYIDLDANEVFARTKYFRSSKPIWLLQIFQFDGGRHGVSCQDARYRDFDAARYHKLNQLLEAGKAK
jgi:hypothetical protein